MATGLALLIGSVVPARAQQRGDRALFGGGVGSAEQVVSVSSNVAAQFFKRIGQPSPTDVDFQLPADTWTRLGRASGQVSYTLGTRFLTLNAFGGRSSLYYPDAPGRKWLHLNIYDVDMSLGPGFSRQFGQRTRVTVRAGAGVRPAYWGVTGFQGTPDFTSGGVVDPNLLLPPDVANLGGVAARATGGVGVSHELSRRVSLYGAYDIEQQWIFGREDGVDVLGQTVSAGTRVQITRHLGVRGGYRFSDSRRGPIGSPHVRTQGADIGIDYSRGGTLRLTRNTTLSANGGASAATDTSGNKGFFFLGGATLLHEIGRTWTTSVSYSRDLRFSSLFQEPILSDTVRGDFGGLITSRLAFRSGAAYSRGAVGFLDGGNGISFGNTFVSLQSGLTRYLSLGVMHSFFYRAIQSQVVAPEGLSRQSKGQVVSVYLSAWAPVFHRARRSNATR